MLRWFLADLRTGKRILDLQVMAGASWQVVLNQPDTLRAVVDLQDQRNIALNLRNTSTLGKTILAVASGDRILAAGIVWTRRSLGDGRTLELGARGVWSYYDHRYILPTVAATLPVSAFTIPDPLDATKTIPNPLITTSFIAKSIGTIVKGLVQQAHAWTGGSLPIVFMADEAGIHERTYLGPEMKNLGTVLKQLTSVEDGVDIAFRPQFTSDRLGIQFLLLTGTNAQPLIAGPTESVWDMSVPRPAATGLEVFEDASRLASLGWATGGRAAGVSLVSRASDPVQVANGYPLYEALDSSHSTVQEQDTLDAWAAEIVARGATPLEQFSFNVSPTRAPFLTNYNVGDYSRVILPPYSDPDLPPILLRTNHATNPGAEAVGGLSAAQRTNLFTDPRSTSLASYATSNGTGVVSGGAYTWTANATGAARLIATAAAFAASTTYLVRMTVEASRSQTVSINYRPTAAVTTGQVVIAAVDLVAGIAQDLAFIVTTSATAPSATSGFGLITPGGATIGETLKVSSVHVEQTAVIRPGFDGSQALRPDGYTATWDGVPDASTSSLRGTTSSGWVPVGTGVTHTRFTGEAHSGGACYRVDTLGNANDGIVYSLGKATVPGDVTSVGIWCKAPAGTKMYAADRLTTNTPTDKVVFFTATGDWQWVTVEEFAAATGSPIWQVFVRLQFSAGQPVTIYTDDAQMELAPTVGSQFSGDTRSNVDYLYRWSGAKDASTSTQSSQVVPGRKRGHPYFLEGGDFRLRIVALSGTEKDDQVAVTAMPRTEEVDG